MTLKRPSHGWSRTSRFVGVIVTGALLIVACDSTTSGSGGSGGGAGGGGAGGGDVCDPTGSQVTCECCTKAGLDCAAAGNAPGGTYFSCFPKVVVGPDEFKCGGTLACSKDELCVTSTPCGDGPYGSECRVMPPGCVDSPTCECILAALGDSKAFDGECTETDGTFKVSCSCGACLLP